MAAMEMVEAERRQADRRACLHVATDADRRGELLNRDERARTETMLCETQAAADHALDALAHAISASQTLLEALRVARAASVASRRAAHLAAGAVSGTSS